MEVRPSEIANLSGKVASVTGAGRGIGQRLAVKLAQCGASVVVNDLDAEPAAETVQLIEDTHGSAIACSGSVTDDSFAQRFVDTALEAYGRIDIIVNNTGRHPIFPQRRSVYALREQRARSAARGGSLRLKVARLFFRDFPRSRHKSLDRRTVHRAIFTLAWGRSCGGDGAHETRSASPSGQSPGISTKAPGTFINISTQPAQPGNRSG